jgi:hypothetical protein
LKYAGNILILIFVSIACCIAGACQSAASSNPANFSNPANPSGDYKWIQVTDKAAYKPGYNYPLYSIKNKLWAFHAEEIFSSADDGKTWTKSKLPSIRRNLYEAQYARFGDAVYAFGRNSGNYEKMNFKPVVSRTADFEKWEVLTERSNLPGRIFMDIVEFKGKLWMLGGFDGKNYYNDVWNSADGVTWTRVAEKTPWEARNTYNRVVIFKDKLWLIGGGKIDQPPVDDVWNSEDGNNWTRVTEKMYTQSVLGGTPVVYDNKLWLLGINRNDTFSNGMLVSADGKEWKEEAAPWSPRGGIAACVHQGRLYMTGGKYSVTENGRIKFIYSNDVWYMERSAK